MKNKYTYLVTYFHSGGQGRVTMNRKKKISSAEDIVGIEKLIGESSGFKNVGIKNFILLDTKWGFWEWIYTIVELTLLALCVLTLIASIWG